MAIPLAIGAGVGAGIAGAMIAKVVFIMIGVAGGLAATAAVTGSAGYAVKSVIDKAKKRRLQRLQDQGTAAIQDAIGEDGAVHGQEIDLTGKIIKLKEFKRLVTALNFTKAENRAGRSETSIRLGMQKLTIDAEADDFTIDDTDIPANAQKVSVNFAGYKLSRKNIKALASTLDHGSCVFHLDLSHNGMTKGSSYITKVLGEGSPLLSLNLAGNPLGSNRLADLLEQLKRNDNLEVLNLNSTGIKDFSGLMKVCAALRVLLKRNNSLRIIDIGCKLKLDPFTTKELQSLFNSKRCNLEYLRIGKKVFRKTNAAEQDTNASSVEMSSYDTESYSSGDLFVPAYQVSRDTDSHSDAGDKERSSCDVFVSASEDGSQSVDGQFSLSENRKLPFKGTV